MNDPTPIESVGDLPIDVTSKTAAAISLLDRRLADRLETIEDGSDLPPF